MGKTALVTGSDGFVGRHLASRLTRDGWDVTGVDVKSGVDCRDVFRHDTARYDLVLHCAAVVGGRQMIDGQPMQVATDLAIDSDFFQYVLRTRPRRSVYFSSSAAYPVALQDAYHPHVPFRVNDYRLEESDVDLGDVRQPDAVYGWVKLTGEQLARHANAEGAGVYVVRPFSGYGADQDPTYPFRRFLQRAVAREDPFKVWGPGAHARDWVHIDDVVQFLMTMLEWDPYELGPVNVCTGVRTTFLELAELFARAVGYEPQVTPLPDKPTGVLNRVGDPTRMNRVHKPTVTIEEGVERAVHGA